MHALLHTFAVLTLLPYMALALMFVLIGQLAGSKGLWALVDTVVNQADALVRWGLYAAALLWLSLLLMGWIPRLQRLGALCLCLLALICLGLILMLSSTPMKVGQLVFLLPCVAVAVAAAWWLWRAGGVF